VVGCYLYYTMLVLWSWLQRERSLARGARRRADGAFDFSAAKAARCFGAVYMVATLGVMTIIQSVLAYDLRKPIQEHPGLQRDADLYDFGVRA
jgi:hypothetical protein